MPEFTITVQGLDRLQDELSELPDNLNEAIGRGLLEAASQAVEQIQEEISEPAMKAAEEYVGSHAYLGSYPGEPPKLRTGTLMRSVRIASVEDDRVTISIGGAETFAPYASYLEFGTSWMAPRPFVQPIIERILPEVGNIILETVNAATQETMR